MAEEPSSTAEEGQPAQEIEIPEEWGWPKTPYEPEDLKEFVLFTTQQTSQEKWDAQLEARALDSKLEDHIAEKAFANLLLNKEGTGEAKDGKVHEGIDPNTYKAGRWYRFLNHKGDCHVYVHNYTRDVTAARPENFMDLTDEEKRRLQKLGTYIKELPNEINKVYDHQKAIPIIYCSQETAEAIKTFFIYDKNGQLLDATKLKRVNAAGLEESRKAIVNAMKLGTTLCVYLGDIIPDFKEKICISKNRDTFPISLFRYGGLDSNMVTEKIYREDDLEAGKAIVRDGFRVCIVLMFDSMNYEMSSMRKEELPSRIPDFDHMHQMRCYNDDDKKKILDLMRK
eukprot:TRINITY_DN75284_c0_g1_i1.p1 TRINITY_DN75284_c0_g1~~TRINITY_DN75284_c0_g1_i1.p1  ORF type:complete len:367 (-),score=89.18 TRINITY_DN75284_c0_g1_i1:91-1110(-)